LARVTGQATCSQHPSRFTTAPIGAIRRLLETTGWRVEDVDLFEINEAFAMVTLMSIEEFSLEHARVNVHGGACALGHPIGSSGSRIIATLLYAMQRYGKQRGIAALCIGGGEATAMAFERL
jgi:acetyl-CoA C-acetyltransferase